MDQQSAFEQAVIDSKQLASRPDNKTLLHLYSLYKQATEGDLDENAPKPGMFDFVAKAKYDAWEKLKGTSQDNAKQQYTRLIWQLAAGDHPKL